VAEASFVRTAGEVRVTVQAAAAAGEFRQLADGRAAYLATGQTGAAAGDNRSFKADGQVTLPKAAGVTLLDGGRAFWDHSANAVTFRKVNDRDFYAGRVVGDAADGDTTCTVNLNVDPRDDIDLLRDAALSVATGTQAAGGFGLPAVFGGARGLSLTATNEAQCVDLLSVDRFDKAANAIVEALIRVAANGSTGDVDFNVGIASGTHASDADAITEHVFFHLDGGSVDIRAQSKDGTTTVAATDTTVDVTAGPAVANRKEFWIDTRDPANVKLYVDAVRVLPATVFRIDGAAGPLGLLAHLEKAAGTATAGPVYIDRLSARLAEQ
jgi:predicted RecA/RadA family phage recombinase